jgi:hypothetical protein
MNTCYIVFGCDRLPVIPIRYALPECAMYMIQMCLQVRTWLHIHNTFAERNRVAGALLPYLLLPVAHTAQLAPPEQ